MPIAKLPQPYGLRIEMIRAAGYSGQELLAVLLAADSEELRDQINKDISWDVFLEYVKEEWLTVKTAVLYGYRYKFLTIGGLKDLLSIRFRREEGVDYRFDGEQVEGLLLGQEELEALMELLAVNWNIDQGIEQSIELLNKGPLIKASDAVQVSVTIRHTRTNVLTG
jgi:hypothetical protein